MMASAKTQSSPAARTLVWLTAGCAGFAALLALLCLGSAALAATQPVTQTLLFKPVVLRAGNFGLSAAASGTPDCPPEIVDCAVPIMPGQMYASVWFSIRTTRQGSVTLSYRPLLRLRLR